MEVEQLTNEHRHTRLVVRARIAAPADPFYLEFLMDHKDRMVRGDEDDPSLTVWEDYFNGKGW